MEERTGWWLSAFFFYFIRSVLLGGMCVCISLWAYAHVRSWMVKHTLCGSLSNLCRYKPHTLQPERPMSQSGGHTPQAPLPHFSSFRTDDGSAPLSVRLHLAYRLGEIQSMLEPHAELQVGCSVLPNTRKVSTKYRGKRRWPYPLYTRGQNML